MTDVDSAHGVGDEGDEPTAGGGAAAHDPADWERGSSPGAHVWWTLGWRRGRFGRGWAEVLWEAGHEHAFLAGRGVVVHGGLLSALMDVAMASAAWTVTGPDRAFLTADIRAEFHRAAPPGPLTAIGRVERLARSAVFCSAEVLDPDGRRVARGAATQILLPAG